MIGEIAQPLEEIVLDDLVVAGDALVARTSMGALASTPLGSVLLAGLEREAAARQPALGRAIEATGRAPIDDAGSVVVTARPMDAGASLLAIGVEYGSEAGWFEEFVREFHGGKAPQGTLTSLGGGIVLGILAKDTRVSWGTERAAAACAVKLSPRIVAYVVAPDAGQCRAWASWVAARREGDPDLLGKLAAFPGVGDGKATAVPPVVAYFDGDRFGKMKHAPAWLRGLLDGVGDSWIGIDPGSPARLIVASRYHAEEDAAAGRDGIAAAVDGYSKLLHLMFPGLAAALDGLRIDVDGKSMTLSLEIQEGSVEQLAAFLASVL